MGAEPECRRKTLLLRELHDDRAIGARDGRDEHDERHRARSTSSAASSGKSSRFHAADRYSMTRFLPTTWPSSRSPSRNA
jgi:hypothetical protein